MTTDRTPFARRLALPLAVTAVLLAAGVATAVEHHFAGSAQLDYLFVPTEDKARDITFDGFTTELSLKLSADINEHVSVHVKTCYGCHGFEMGMAFADLRVADALTFRVGRFTPSFGDFPVRHDPANHRTSDKPLPYDMGRMLRLREWNMSILPAPYVDNGLEVRGVHGLSHTVDLEYAAYVVGGLRGAADATDVDFSRSRSRNFYYVDNNSRPSVGGRLGLGAFFGRSSLELGASGMYGTYDPDNDLDYLILGADLVLRIRDWSLRAEYLLRRTQMALGADPASRFRYGPGADGEFDPYALKDGFYVETEYDVGEHVELVGRVDGLRRIGNVPVGSPLRKRSAVLRYTAGGVWKMHRHARLKLSAELYDFSDFRDEVAVHLGFVGAF
ncbi:MAG: hypothetical protein ACQEXJ_09555 [Myxococcota bacterium]